jgi:hypothetical protein
MPRSTNARITAATAFERKLKRKDAQILTLKACNEAYEIICNDLTAERDEARASFTSANDLVGEQQSRSITSGTRPASCALRSTRSTPM